MVFSRRTILSGLLTAVGAALTCPRRGFGASRPALRRILDQMELEALAVSRPRRHPDMRLRSGEDGGCLLCRRRRGRTGEVGGLNAVGCFIWEDCNGVRTPKEIANRVHQRYRVSQRRAWADTMAFLRHMKQKGAIV